MMKDFEVGMTMPKRLKHHERIPKSQVQATSGSQHQEFKGKNSKGW